MLSFINELLYDNCDLYDTVTNITKNCGTDINMADENCYPECNALPRCNLDTMLPAKFTW